MSEITDKWKNLRRDMGNLISAVDGKIEKIDAEEKRMENKRDESYLKGTEDMRKAINMLYDACHIGLTSQKMENLFGTKDVPSIIGRFPAITIIDVLKHVLKEQEQEFKVGDEVEFWDTNCELFKKYVIIKADPSSTVIWLLNLKTFCRIWFDKDKITDLKKTGRHFDTIDIPKEGIAV